MTNQWERFKQSNIAKIFLGYAVVAWVLIQLIEAVLPTFETPLWVAQTLTFLLILGFPIALLIGWAYERLPAKEVKNLAASVSAEPVSRKPLLLFGTASCIAVGLFGFYLMPFVFDESKFLESGQVTNSVSASTPNYRSIRSQTILGITGIRALHLTRSDIAISPNGRLLAYTVNVAVTGGSQDIFLKDLTTTAPARLLGRTSGAGGNGLLYFSQDGQWLHFIDAGQMARVRIEGGTFQSISNEYSVLRSGFTAFDEQIIFSRLTDRRLYRVPVAGGEARQLPIIGDEATQTRTYTWPRVLPGNTHLLVTSSENDTTVGDGNVELYDLETGNLRLLISAAYNATYVPSGHIIFVRDATLWAVPFNLDNLTLTGPQIPVIQGIETNRNFGHAAYAVEETGKLYYLPGSEVNNLDSGTLRWVDRAGGLLETIAEDDGYAYGNLSISPSGNQLSVTRFDDSGSSDIFVLDMQRGTLERRTFNGDASQAIWSPDETELLYSSGSSGINSISADGTGQPNEVLSSTSVARPFAISPQYEMVFDMGARLYLMDLNQNANNEVIFEELNLGPSLMPVHSSTLSPNGNWLAYTSQETGIAQTYIRPFPNIDDGKWQVPSRTSAFAPIWHPNGRELFFYEGAAATKFSIPYTEGAIDENDRPGLIEFGAPQELFNVPIFFSPQMMPVWAYSAQRDNILISQSSSSLSLDQALIESIDNQTILTVVDDWFEELQVIVPSSQ
ncbi:MAG: hypothetical protein CMQ41_12345 [Gammaproteobacteria bacterium]|nr:hypothetical protein [Gammaproteobacteria bacterium]